MSEYDELIKRLQHAAMLADKGLVIPPSLVLQAANAIENLQGQLSVCLEGTKVRFVKNDDGTEEIRFENRWVPVTELPPKGETYGDTTFSVEVLGTEGFTYRKAYYNFRYKVWLDGNEEKEWPSITHWMPLPEPPKEEADA